MKEIKMTGSEKQIAWAKSIVESAYATIEAHISGIQANKEKNDWVGYDKMICAWESVRSEFDSAIDKLSKSGLMASTIIDNRRLFSSESLLKKYYHYMKA